MPSRIEQSAQPWTTNYDTVRRQRLFQNPPADKTAYPTLIEAIRPHIDSFNTIFETDGLIERGLQEIGHKSGRSV